jgi:hypothetical protein
MVEAPDLPDHRRQKRKLHQLIGDAYALIEEVVDDRRAVLDEASVEWCDGPGERFVEACEDYRTIMESIGDAEDLLDVVGS